MCCVMLYYAFLILGMFYFTLGNLRPELRSTQRSIQLISCVSSENIKRYGMHEILKPFISDVNSLCEVNNYIVHVNVLYIGSLYYRME